MASETEEAIIELGQCKCCLNDNDLRDLWAEYICSETGESEIYGEMLIDCYFLSWSPPEDHKEEYICETCVHRLRDAYNFKNDILQSERLLSEVGTTEFEDQPSKQNSKHSNVINEVEYLEENPRESCDEEEDSGDEIYLELTEDVQDEDFEEVEYLEEELTGESNAAPIKSSYNRNKSMVAKDSNKNQYKNYSAEKTVAVSLQLSLSEAKYQAEGDYHIKKSLGSRPDLLNNRERRRNAKLLLLHSTVLPFKWCNDLFKCIYCLTEFSKIEDLRTHNNKAHNNPTYLEIEKASKTIRLSDDIKIDILNQACRLCNDKIHSFETLKEHLNEKHQRNIGVNNDGLLPFKLVKTGDFNCALCDENYTEYNKLNTHMNKHYQKYFCEECKAGFLSLSRLQKHQIVHSTKEYPCRSCDKTFKHPSIRHTHYNFVHMKRDKWRCRHCGMTFKNHKHKLQHVVEEHKLSEKLLCVFCTETCLSQTHLERHVKRFHMNVKNYVCDICDKRFFFASELRSHEKSHYKSARKSTQFHHRRVIDLEDRILQ